MKLIVKRRSAKVQPPIKVKLEGETGIFWQVSLAVRQKLRTWEERNHMIMSYLELGSDWLKSKLNPLKVLNDKEKPTDSTHSS